MHIAYVHARDPLLACKLRQGEEEPAPAGSEPPLVGAEFRRSIARNIIDQCLGKAFDQRVEECRQQRLAYRFAAQHCIRTLDSLIHVEFAVHDPGDKAADVTWHGGEEPAPVVMDTWARGMHTSQDDWSSWLHIPVYFISHRCAGMGMCVL
jgi:hypothetical protein